MLLCGYCSYWIVADSGELCDQVDLCFMGCWFLRIKCDFTYTDIKEGQTSHRKMIKCWIMNRYFQSYLPKVNLDQRGWWTTEQHIGSIPGRHTTEQRIREMYRICTPRSSLHWIISPLAYLDSVMDQNFYSQKLFWVTKTWIISSINCHDHISLYFSHWEAVTTIFKNVLT